LIDGNGAGENIEKSPLAKHIGLLERFTLVAASNKEIYNSSRGQRTTLHNREEGNKKDKSGNPLHFCSTAKGNGREFRDSKVSIF